MALPWIILCVSDRIIHEVDGISPYSFSYAVQDLTGLWGSMSLRPAVGLDVPATA